VTPRVMRRPLVPGWCFLCRRGERLVMWIGPLEHDGQTAPIYACEECCEFARQYIAQYQWERDARPTG
jgi:hypothetical protein